MSAVAESPARAENFADIWELVARRQPAQIALVHDDRRVSWGDLDRRADALACALAHAGIRRGETVGQYLYNCTEYLETTFALFKGGFVPVNTNYRYVDEELVYLWANADVTCVIFHATFADRITPLRERLPHIRAWLCVAEPSMPSPNWAIDYEQAVARGGGAEPDARTGDDIWLLYTGGTTGMPKGVVWRQRDLIGYLLQESPSAPDRTALAAAPAGPVHLCACPLMHGTGSMTSFQALSAGGRVVTLTDRSFRAESFLGAVERERVTTTAVVGDAFCRPILDALDANPGRWDISSLTSIASSGVIWSADVKAALLRHHPDVALIDSLSSSEAVGIARNVAFGPADTETATFTASPNTCLLDDAGNPLPRGTGAVGRVAVTGHLPLGYYKDPEKTARAFIVHEGRRYAVPGDFATIDADGTLHLLGRGSACINTGGEKVFAEEVEEALKRHPAVEDVAVIGLPDERLGQRIVGIVQRGPDADVDEPGLIAHVKMALAGYKAPKQILFVTSLERGPNGKLDYPAIRELAAARLA